MMLLLVVGFALIALVDLVPLIRRRKWRAVAAFASLFAVALTIGVLRTLCIDVPSTMYAWGNFIKWLGIAYPP